MIATVGHVTSEAPGAVLISTSRPPADNLSGTVTVCWSDARTISPDQRRKAYALMGEIAAWSGSSPEEVKAAMKVDFRQRAFGGLQQGLISLSDCTMTEARGFISMLIDFMLEMDVSSKVPLWDYNDDVAARYIASVLHAGGRRSSITWTAWGWEPTGARYATRACGRCRCAGRIIRRRTSTGMRG